MPMTPTLPIAPGLASQDLILEFIVDTWNQIIIQPMINTLVLLYSWLLLDFGIAIIAFTLIVRTVMIPLTVKQSRQIKAMTALQPKMKAIQEKYKGERGRSSRETMALYKEQGVNPLGCLGPMFIQFPIWIGLYQAILQTVPSKPESLVGLSKHLYDWLPQVHSVIPIDSSFLWMDLAAPDPSPFIMPILVGASMWIMQKMTTMPTADERQASTNRIMLWMMPAMFGFFTLNFPSGLALYWVVSNVVGVVIQGFVTGWDPLLKLLKFNRKEEAQLDVAPAPAIVPPTAEETNDAPDRNVSENGGRGNRGRPKGARRRSQRRRNRRR